jgi:hypothetical protein
MNQSIASPLALALGLVTAGDALAAGNADPALDGAYVSAGIGASTIDRPGMGAVGAYDVGVGYRWNGFGFEAGYNGWSAFERDIPVTGGTHRHTIDLDGWSVGVADRVALDDRWYATARAGVFRWTSRYRYGPVEGPRDTYRDKGSDWYGGAGLGYRVNANLGVSVNADYLKAEGHYGLEYTTTRLTLNAEYAF